jgi:acetyl-CoA C-acetyltransferase
MGATDLGGLVIKAVIRRAGIAETDVNEVIMGQVLPCGYGQNPAKQAAVKAGLPWEVECHHRQQGLRFRPQGRHAGGPGHPAGGCRRGGGRRHGKHEHGPLLPGESPVGLPHGAGQLEDHMVHDGLWDIVNDFHMGISNELCSEKYGIDPRRPGPLRRRVLPPGPGGHRSRAFKDEIMPVEIPQRKGDPVIFDTDECPGKPL